MRNKFETQLMELHSELIGMGALCEDAISCAISSLLKGDSELSARASEKEKELDRTEKDIESFCLKLILQQQPVAKDLHMISAVLKMITDMERIGDQAADIAELSRFIKLEQNKNSDNIRHMATSAINMVTNSIDAFVKSDIELAKYVIECDNEVDDLFILIKNDIIEEISQNAANGEAAIDIIMIAKYLERIGDHATNIAEWVVFAITGKHPT